MEKTDGGQIAKEDFKVWIALIAISVLYVIFFARLHYIYDWDTISRAIWLSNGEYQRDAGVTHFMVTLMAAALVQEGVEPLESFRILTAVFMMITVLGCYRLVLSQTSDSILAFLASLFILFNNGFTFLLTTLEDNIWMYAPLTLFAWSLMQRRIALSALFLSAAILIHIQSEVFIPMLLLYVLLDEDLRRSSSKYIPAMIAFLLPIGIAYSYLALYRGWRLQNFVQNLIAAGPAYHGDPGLWFFASNNTIDRQLHLAAYGFVSTFVCRYPDYLKSMPRSEIFGAAIAILIVYMLAWCMTKNRKVLCAVPTFSILFFHAVVFESWSIERWDFLPFFVVYFLAAGYTSNKDDVKRQLKWILALTVVLTAMFTFCGMNAISGLQEGPVCAYADHLSETLKKDNSSFAIEFSLKPRSTHERYIEYMCGDRVSFTKKADSIPANLTANRIYTSYATYQSLPGIVPRRPLDSKTVWTNPIDKSYSVVLLKPRKAKA